MYLVTILCIIPFCYSIYSEMSSYLPDFGHHNVDLFLPDKDSHSHYFSIVSMTHLQPILSGYKTSGEMRGNTKREHYFRECQLTNITHDDYTGNQHYDRGHQISSEEIGIQYADQAQTFSMCNVGPQTPSLNRGKWEWLEHFTLCMGVSHKNIVVLDGPMGPFRKGFKSDTNVLANVDYIPTYWWKVIIAEKHTGFWLFKNNDNHTIDEDEGYVGKKGFDLLEKEMGIKFPASVVKNTISKTNACAVFDEYTDICHYKCEHMIPKIDLL